MATFLRCRPGLVIVANSGLKPYTARQEYYLLLIAAAHELVG
jgi:hypothetical protein